MRSLKLLCVTTAVWVLLFCMGSAYAQVTFGTMTLEQAPGSPVIVRFSGYSSACDIPIVLPDAVISGQEILVRQLPPSSGACTAPEAWTRTVSLGVLTDGDYSVHCLYDNGFAAGGTWPCGYSTFRVANGLLVQYEHVPVPAVGRSAIWILGLVLMVLAMTRLRGSARGRAER